MFKRTTFGIHFDRSELLQTKRLREELDALAGYDARETGRVVAGTEIKLGVSELVMERYGVDGGVTGLDREVRVEGYEVTDLDGDEYPEIRFDVVERDTESGQEQRRRVRFVYSEGELSECCVTD